MNLRKPENPTDTFVFSVAFVVADWCCDWLPTWSQYVLALPFWAVACVAACGEYAVRYLLTPAKIWEGR